MKKEELLKAIEQKRQEIWPTDTGEMKPATVPNNLESGWLNALTWMMRYINSLPAEQPSEELEEAAEEYSGKSAHPLNNAFKAGANWQKEQIINKAYDWLKDNFYQYGEDGKDNNGCSILYEFKKAMEDKR